MSALQPTGPIATTLMIIRGPSGSGKTTISRAVRQAYDRRCALVQQDVLRRVVLRELDVPGGLAPTLIEQTARFALDNGLHAVVEGIMTASRYKAMLTALIASHRGSSHVFYLDVPFEETVVRHATRPQATEFTPDQMREWYVPHDVLGVPGEIVIPASFSAQDSIDLIHATTGFVAHRDRRHTTRRTRDQPLPFDQQPDANRRLVSRTSPNPVGLSWKAPEFVAVPAGNGLTVFVTSMPA